MKILRTKNDLKEAINKIKYLGFVPTMGSLHSGHISLIKKSKLICNKTLVSIYVNPKQFNSKKDFSKYPKNITRDLNILKKLRIDFVFTPSTKEIYKEKRIKKIVLPNKYKVLCAKSRKGHFEGVLDIMDRFIKLINPKYTFMGEKDFQQLFLVNKFIGKKYKNKIFPCKTVRDKNFLALSSRNFLLSKNEFNGKNFSEFKEKLSDLLVEKIGPISKEIKKLLNDVKYLDNILLEGSQKADRMASIKIKEIKKIIGI